MRFRSDGMLFLAALIWGAGFAAQRVADRYIGPLTYNGLRFLLGALLLLAFSIFFTKPGQGEAAVPAPRRVDYIWVGVTGLSLFAGSALQQVGMRYTTAGNAGFLTSLYVVLVPIILLAIRCCQGLPTLRVLGIQINPEDLPTAATWVAVLIAGVGVFLLSGANLSASGRASGTVPQGIGDALELLGAIFWALHVILVGRLVRRLPVMPFMVGQFAVSGVLNLAAGLALEGGLAAGLAQAWWTVPYSGILSIGVGFTLQALGQRHAPPADAALILSLESVFAALVGFLALGEQLDPRQALGCGLIFAAILLAQFNKLPIFVAKRQENKG